MQNRDSRKKGINSYDDIEVPPMVKYRPKESESPKKKNSPKRTVSENRAESYQNSGRQKPQNTRSNAANGKTARNIKNTSNSSQQRKRTSSQNSRQTNNARPYSSNQKKQVPKKRAQNGYNNNRQKNFEFNDKLNELNSFKQKHPWVQPLFLAVIVAAVVLGIAFAANLISGSDEKKTEKPKKEESQVVTLTENLTSGTVQGNLRQWSNAEGGIIQDENVMNVLLLGVDDTNGETRSDTMILLSLNKETQKIYLVSFYRDSYAYFQDENGVDHFGKINSAYKLGGGELSIKTVEKLFKIKIDHFVSVNFETFTNVINALGGIDIDVEQYEADYIRKTSRYKDMPYGKNVHLSGEEALVYARIRKCDADSDISRTRRQRKVIDALISKTKSASVSQLVGLADKLLPYVVTDYSKKEIISTGTEAITKKWMDFEKHQISCVTIGENGWNKSLNGTDIVLVDYPACAKKLQEMIYGKSLITLSGNEQSRVTANELFTQDKIFES